MKEIKVLVVDDNQTDRFLINEYLTSAEVKAENTYQITEADGPSKAIELLKIENFDCIITDFLMLDGDGLDFINRLKDLRKNLPPIIFTTSYGNDMIKEDSLLLGAKMYLDKSEINSGSLHKHIKNILKN